MNPTEALPQDYNLYYNHTYMMKQDVVVAVNTRRGPRFVLDEDGDELDHGDEGRERADFYCKAGADAFVEPTSADELKIWWPRAGAYNGQGYASYIGRRARRSMRKSASTDHYYNIWSGAAGMVIGRTNLWIMAHGPNSMAFEAGIAVLNARAMTSVAITRHIILNYKAQDEYEVLYMGQSCGTLNKGVLSMDFPALPLSALCEAELTEVMT